MNIEGDSHSAVVLKAAFWEWDRYSECEERWEVGDFFATIDGLRHDAIGVSFDLTGLCEMLPLEKRPELARKVSVAGDPAWVTAKAARAFMYSELTANPNKASFLLLNQSRLGFVAARAVERKQADEGDADHWILEEREWDIPLWFWQSFTSSGESSQDWERGVFAGRGVGPAGPHWITLSGVYFAKASLEAMLPENAVAKEHDTPVVAALPKGRPPAAFWDDLWCAVWGRVYRGELIPKRQADVESAMLD